MRKIEGILIAMLLLLVLNSHSYYLFTKDKKLARSGAYRLSEKRLVLSSVCLGGVGALLAMRIARHKTKHLLFQIVVPLSALLTLCVGVWLLVHLLDVLMIEGIVGLTFSL